ncbi:hypothetical protein HRI96_02550 [Treponema parvum]|uniref:Lipoprotein n=1 Tax=Treponema parvum TaxID=138851 RepID=A0A975EY94_9SPIR|nr:hypothetical protein [Treponema parvum]QTQ11171.1 hypothetical protein HRI96_02550 [Treponema parvum]
MKNKNLAVIAFFVTAVVVFFTGCQDEIFNTIRDEIKLEDLTVRGHINSIVRYKDGGTEYILTQNGNVYYKDSSIGYHTDWTKDPTLKGTAVKLAADVTYIYALLAKWANDETEGKWVRVGSSLVCKSGISGAWSTVHEIDGNTTVILFCTNAVRNTNRKAYVRIGSSVYLLNGTSAPSIVTTGSANASTVPTSSTQSAVFNPSDGKTYFFNSAASVTNETSTLAATHMYYAEGDHIYHTSTAPVSWTGLDVGSATIYSMSYTGDYLVLGTSRGYQRCALSSNAPAGSINNDFSNASSTLSSYYEVWAILAVDPEATEAGNSIYAAVDYSGSSSSTSAVFNNIGLWGYYASRGKWNRE